MIVLKLLTSILKRQNTKLNENFEINK